MLEQLQQIKTFTGGRLIGLYGRGSSGKTTVSSSFPNPVFIIFDDQGLNSIKADCPNAPYMDASGYSSNQMLSLIDEISKVNECQDTTYVFSTFSVWIDNHSTLLMKEKGKAHMNQDLWAENNTRICQVIAKMAEVAKTKRIVLEFHERTSVIEGFADELTPEVSINAGPGIQKYLVGMLNYAFHTSIKSILNPQNINEKFTCYAIDINPLNEYYWIKGQGIAPNAPAYIIVGKGTAYAELKKYFNEI